MKKKKGTNVYEKKITLGRAPDGTPVRKSITGRTIAELNQRIEDAKQKWMEMNSVNDGVLFSTYARRWFNTNKAVRSMNTRFMYENVIEKHLIPEIGDLYFSEIRLADLQMIINKRSEHYNTCSKIKLTLKQIYESAIDDEIAKDIKVKNLVLPPKTYVEKRPLSQGEIDSIFTTDLPDEQRMFVHALYYLGIRREESLALEVNDIDFENSTISINKVIVFDKNNPVLKHTTKSYAGTRLLPVPADFMSELIEYTPKCKRLLFGQPTHPQDYMTQSSYTKFWQGIIKKLNTPDLTAHVFRHNYVTMLHYAGITPKKAAQLLGDSSIEMIMRIYTHLDERKENTIDKINDMFKKEKPQTSPEPFR